MIIEKCQAETVANSNTTAQRNTTGKRQKQYTNCNATQLAQQHNTQLIPTQHNATQPANTKLQTDMQQAVELVDRLKTSRKNWVKKRYTFEIGQVVFVGLHGLDVKKHMEGWHVILVFVHVFLLLPHLIGLQGLKTRGGTPFGAKTWTSTFAFLFFLSEFLRGESSLNETTVGLSVHVLVAGRTIQVPALMTYNTFEPHFQFEASGTSTLTKANGVLRAGRGFSRMVFGAKGLVTSISKKVTMTVLATSGGFETPAVSMKEIGALFLATGTALDFLF